MSEQGIDERFNTPGNFDPRLTWRNPPLETLANNSRLAVATRGGTDFWQRTHYGFRIANGHCLLCDWHHGDFVLETRVHLRPVHQYDQAGLMIWLSADCWLKTSIEYETREPNNLGAVVTNAGWSDWSMQKISKSVSAISLRVRREGADYLVDYALTASPDVRSAWSPIRIAHLAEDDSTGQMVQCGLYACSPKGEGFIAEFDYVKVTPGRLGSA